MQIAALILSTLLVASILSAQHVQAVALGQTCDGSGPAVCDKGLWCEPQAGTCGATAGVCVAIPRLCVARKKSKSFQPVCGCNSKTYSSDCFRRAYKVTKSHDGKC
jgi:Kazal-type serine protease inhibitor-like protein